MIDPDLFFRCLKGCCCSNQFYGINLHLFDSVAFHISLTSYANLLKIGPVTPEITKVTNAPFAQDGKNRLIPPNISATTILQGCRIEL